MSIDITEQPDPENVKRILLNLKQVILNEDSREVAIADKYFRKFLATPEYWAKNWKDRENRQNERL